MRERELLDPASVRRKYDAVAADGYVGFRHDPRTRHRWNVIEAPLFELTRHATQVLDLGCGTGRTLGQIRSPFAIGVDLSPGMLRRARADGLRVALADAHRLPFRDGAFDAIIASDGVFRYLDYERAFRECARVLRPGGGLESTSTPPEPGR